METGVERYARTAYVKAYEIMQAYMQVDLNDIDELRQFADDVLNLSISMHLTGSKNEVLRFCPLDEIGDEVKVESYSFDILRKFDSASERVESGSVFCPEIKGAMIYAVRARLSTGEEFSLCKRDVEFITRINNY